MSCKFCLFKDRMQTVSIPIYLLKSALNQAKKMACKRVALTGGESCLHPRFEEVIDLIVERDYVFSLVSNGYDTQKYYDTLNKYPNNFKTITFSLDGPTEEIHDKIIESLNEADEKLTATEFSQLAESIIDYIDEISRSK